MQHTRWWLVAVLCLAGAGWLGACQTSESSVRTKAKAVELLEQADRSFELGSFAEALELYKLASVAARTEKSGPRFAEAAAQVAATLSVMGQGDGGVQWLAQAKAEDNGKDLAAHTRVQLANALALRDASQFQAALGVFEELFHTTMEHQMWGRALQAGTLASVVASPAARLEWSQRALQAAEASGERAWIAAAYQAIGFVYEERGDYVGAVEQLRKARDLSPAGSRDRLKSEWALVHNLRLAGELDEAGQILVRIIPEAKALHARGFAGRDAEWLGRCQEELAELLAARGQWLEALRAMNSARQAYQLAEMQDRAPQKWRELEARFAELKMLRIQHERNREP